MPQITATTKLSPTPPLPMSFAKKAAWVAVAVLIVAIFLVVVVATHGAGLGVVGAFLLSKGTMPLCISVGSLVGLDLGLATYAIKSACSQKKQTSEPAGLKGNSQRKKRGGNNPYGSLGKTPTLNPETTSINGTKESSFIDSTRSQSVVGSLSSSVTTTIATINSVPSDRTKKDSPINSTRVFQPSESIVSSSSSSSVTTTTMTDTRPSHVQKMHASKESLLTDEVIQSMIPKNIRDPDQRAMLFNLVKSWDEHIGDERVLGNKPSNCWPTREELKSVLRTRPSTRPLTFSVSATAAQGKRETMEDTHFCYDLEDGLLAGVCDGHGGRDVADYLHEHFVMVFQIHLVSARGNIRLAFQKTADSITDNLRSKEFASAQGSTAVVSYIDKRTHIAYTATWGDSEANLYRDFEGRTKSLPLSPMRDFASEHNWNMAMKAARKESRIYTETEYGIRYNFIFEGVCLIHPKEGELEDPKGVRIALPIGHHGNVASAFGDFNCLGAVDFMPQITEVVLCPGDTLLLACDGLKDYVEEDTITRLITEQYSAEGIVDHAINVEESRDNVTVMKIQIPNSSTPPDYKKTSVNASTVDDLFSDLKPTSDTTP